MKNFKIKVRSAINYFTFICHPKNFLLCLKYPFLKRRNLWADTFLGYKYTLYDDIPQGWRIAFGKKLLRELKAAFANRKEMKQFRFHQIKEKYGGLRLYSNFVTEKITKVLSKYENMSYNYCIICGKPAEYETDRWIFYLCKDCYIKYYMKNGGSEKDLAKALEEARVNEKESGE